MNHLTLQPALAWPFPREVAFCDWCEEQATMKRADDDICEACDEKIEARESAEWERNMSHAERMGWMRAREEGVD